MGVVPGTPNRPRPVVLARAREIWLVPVGASLRHLIVRDASRVFFWFEVKCADWLEHVDQGGFAWIPGESEKQTTCFLHTSYGPTGLRAKPPTLGQRAVLRRGLQLGPIKWSKMKPPTKSGGSNRPTGG